MPSTPETPNIVWFSRIGMKKKKTEWFKRTPDVAPLTSPCQSKQQSGPRLDPTQHKVNIHIYTSSSRYNLKQTLYIYACAIMWMELLMQKASSKWTGKKNKLRINEREIKNSFGFRIWATWRQSVIRMVKCDTHRWIGGFYLMKNDQRGSKIRCGDHQRNGILRNNLSDRYQHGRSHPENVCECVWLW